MNLIADLIVILANTVKFLFAFSFAIFFLAAVVALIL